MSHLVRGRIPWGCALTTEKSLVTWSGPDRGQLCWSTHVPETWSPNSCCHLGLCDSMRHLYCYPVRTFLETLNAF